MNETNLKFKFKKKKDKKIKLQSFFPQFILSLLDFSYFFTTQLQISLFFGNRDLFMFFSNSGYSILSEFSDFLIIHFFQLFNRTSKSLQLHR
ncbi:uncharacterized protein CELE_R10A10.1 [Caenorhabditis elegans]|uniref:Uncharacterized protein n=1 Tax=Caenorhabditis elegans TaxID=6239 RepID=P91403_CAEEL|nr:Uncharacterized protein CELE_R10A10.1 [Caenorhabditis elegans]CCD70775.2 Uncharacterized protein CELE_R10A10.1 [Caenorhabditis elegans]